MIWVLKSLHIQKQDINRDSWPIIMTSHMQSYHYLFVSKILLIRNVTEKEQAGLTSQP
jgi:hypothetical protein